MEKKEIPLKVLGAAICFTRVFTDAITREYQGAGVLSHTLALVLVGNAFVPMGASAELALAVCHRRFSAITALHIPRLRAWLRHAYLSRFRDQELTIRSPVRRGEAQMALP